MHPKFQGVLLDLDGTLVDGFTPIVSALNRTFEKFGLPTLPDREIRRNTGMGVGSVAVLFGNDWPRARQYFLDLHDQHYLEQTVALPGAEIFLDSLLGRGIKAAIVTNKGQHRAEAQMARLGWDRKVEVVIGFLDDRPGKPDPLPLLLACQSMQMDVNQTVFFGDGPADMQAASRAGSFPVGLTENFTKDELKSFGARLCFPDLAGAGAWLEQILDLQAQAKPLLEPH